MDMIASTFTILFEEPFWVGIYERESGRQYEVCKVTFGAEPKDYEVNEFLNQNWSRFRFSPSTEVVTNVTKRVNPKRMQRIVHKQLSETGIGTKAQQALKVQQEQGKLEKKERWRDKREEQKERQFEFRQEKRKEKHRGH